MKQQSLKYPRYRCGEKKLGTEPKVVMFLLTDDGCRVKNEHGAWKVQWKIEDVFVSLLVTPTAGLPSRS